MTQPRIWFGAPIIPDNGGFIKWMPMAMGNQWSVSISNVSVNASALNTTGTNVVFATGMPNTTLPLNDYTLIMNKIIAGKTCT